MVSENKALKRNNALYCILGEHVLYVDRSEGMEMKRQTKECVVVPTFDPRRKRNVTH